MLSQVIETNAKETFPQTIAVPSIYRDCFLEASTSPNALLLIFRTTERPVPLEHCLFYSGELFRVCESEKFISQGLKSARETFKKKSSLSHGGSSGSYAGHSSNHEGVRGEKRENFSRGKQNKHSSSQHLGKHTGNGGGFRSNGSSQNNWGARRSEASVWLQLINKLSNKSLLPVSLNLQC